MLLKFPNRRRK
jgi:hypothetical protein